LELCAVAVKPCNTGSSAVCCDLPFGSECQLLGTHPRLHVVKA
jgi:hypothetical protein